MPADASDDSLTDEMAAEQALVDRAREGDQEAFRSLVERYEDMVAATVTGMLGAGPEADDVGQRVFITFYKKLDQYRGDGGVAPYLNRIAVNTALNALKKQKRRTQQMISRDQEEHTPLPDPDSRASMQTFSLKEITEEALQTLSPKHRSVVVLRLIQGYSTRETAEILDIPDGTVLSRLHRARKQLQTLLAPHVDTHAYR